MFNGWMTFAGNEVINATRTVAYAQALMPTFSISDCYNCEHLPDLLDEPHYTTPAGDDAPWYDADRPESADFLGLYPVTLSGFTDSVRGSQVYESLLDGGYVGRPRHRTREMRVVGLLVGRTMAGAEAGMTWLKNVLFGDSCDDCGGGDLCFMVDCPSIDPEMPQVAIDAAVDRSIRHLRNVSATGGPVVIRTHDLRNGGHLIQVEFSLVATSPFVYGEPVPVATAQGGSMAAFVTGATISSITTVPECPTVPNPPDLIDPDCPAIPTPPTAPAMTSACGNPPSSYYSYAIYVPDSALPLWSDVVPTLTIRTGAQPARHVRVRFMPKVWENQTPATLDPCSACGEFVVTYIPAGSTARIDGRTERITIQQANWPEQSAEHMVTGVGTEVFEWPILTCGLGYYVLIDVDANVVVGLDLSISTRE